MIFCEKCIHQKGCGKMLNCNRYEGELERPHGEWIDKGEYAECSLCGSCSGTQFDGVEPIPLKTNFCPNCGADMRDKKDDLAEIIEAVQSMKEGEAE